MKISIDIARALELSADLGSGPMREAELLWLAYQASKRKSIVEVGSWIGAATVALAENTDGHVTCVDTWDGGNDNYLQERLAQHPPGWAYEQFLANTADYRNITTIKRLSLTVARQYDGELFDMIFIDGSHDYANVLADISAWKRLLLPNGILCGDDYDETVFPEVVKAVNEILPSARKIAGSIWADVAGKY